jgi:hypothetical protein
MTTEQNLGPERPSLPAQKVGGPNSSPSAGQTVRERRAREIKIKPYKEDPRRTYFRLLHLLSVTVPSSAEKLLDEFLQELKTDLPEVTRELMAEAIDSSLKQLKIMEEKLAALKRKLSESEGGGKQCA